MSEEIRLAFLAGFAAGFDSSGEGFNGEYAPRLTTERFAGLSERAFMEWLDDSAREQQDSTARMAIGVTHADARDLLQLAMAWCDGDCDRLPGCEGGEHDFQCAMLARERALFEFVRNLQLIGRTPSV